MAPAASEPMSNVDTAWFRMEELVNQMTITAVLTFSEPLGLAELRRVLEERLLKFDRFRQRVRRGGKFQNPRWEEDPGFDLDRHLQTMQLPAPGRKEQLQELASRLMSRPLNFAHPLWKFYLVEGYDEGGAIVARLHHCIADGVTLVRVLLSLTDTTADAPPGGDPHENTANALAADEDGEDGGEAASASVVRQIAAGLKCAGRQGARTALMAARGLGVLGKLAWPTPDPDTVLRGPLSRDKKAAWSEPVLLADVKAIGQTLSGTVNDVLLTAMTGALRRYLERHGEPTEGLDVRAAVPVNLRPLDAPLEMGNGNGFGLVFLALPVGVTDPRERLTVLRRRMDRLKCSPEAPMLLKVLGAVGATTRAIEDQVVTYLARKVTAVATNVPGPRQKLYLAGAPLETLMAWVPQAGRVGLGVSIISYDGTVRLGVVTDARLVSDPETLIDSFYREFEALLAHVPGREAVHDASIAGAPAAEQSAPESRAKARPAPEGEANQPSSSEALSPDRCQATTKAGTQCKLPAQEHSRFCHVHQ